MTEQAGTPGAGHNANAQLCSIVQRIEKLQDEKDILAADIRDVFAEAKGNGYNPQALRVILRKRAADAKAAAELEADVDAYMVALGMAD